MSEYDIQRFISYTTVHKMLFPLNNAFLYVKQIIYVLVYFMYSYLRFSLISTTFTIRMVAKWYQRMVSEA